MHKAVAVLAFIFNKFAALLLIVLILAAVPTVGVVSTLTDKESVKNVLSEGEVYQNLPKHALDLVPYEEEEQREDTVVRSIRDVLEENELIDADVLQQKISNVFDGDFMQRQFEGVIDGVYGYIDGSAEQLEFELSLKDKATLAASEIRSFLTTSLERIPRCSEVDIVKLDGGDFEILELTCLPAGSNLAAEIDNFMAEIEASDGPLGETYTQEDLELNEANLEGIKVVYSAMTLFAFIFWVAFLSLSVMVALTAKNIHRGFIVVGVIHFVLGAFFLLSFGAISQGIDMSEIVIENSEDLSASQQEALEQIIKPVAESLAREVAGHTIGVSVAIMLVGLGSFGLGMLLAKHHVEHLQMHQPNHPEKPAENLPKSSDGGIAMPAVKEVSKPKSKQKSKPAKKKP